jgi:methionyl-tRNA synthetase
VPLIVNDQIYLGSYAGWYAVRDEAYYGEEELTLAPNGKRIAPSGAEVEWVEEPSYFFRLSAWQNGCSGFYERIRFRGAGPRREMKSSAS